jgi:AcrR family transcriptional regulator
MAEPLTKRQLRAAATAEQLLAAARDVFEQRGYVATTVGAITEAANTAHGTFYLYFRNKEDAFRQLMGRLAGELYREPNAPWPSDPYAALEVAIHNYLTVFGANRGLWRCLMEGMHQSPAVQAIWQELRRPFVDRIVHSLQRLVAAGTVRDLDALTAAHALGSMVEWCAFGYCVLDEPSRDARSVDEVAHTLTDLWFHAVYGRLDPQPGDAQAPRP